MMTKISKLPSSFDVAELLLFIWLELFIDLEAIRLVGVDCLSTTSWRRVKFISLSASFPSKNSCNGIKFSVGSISYFKNVFVDKILS